MKRRDALKNIGISAGLIIGTPSIIEVVLSNPFMRELLPAHNRTAAVNWFSF